MGDIERELIMKTRTILFTGALALATLGMGTSQAKSPAFSFTTHQQVVDAFDVIMKKFPKELRVLKTMQNGFENHRCTRAQLKMILLKSLVQFSPDLKTEFMNRFGADVPALEHILMLVRNDVK